MNDLCIGQLPLDLGIYSSSKDVWMPISEFVMILKSLSTNNIDLHIAIIMWSRLGTHECKPNLKQWLFNRAMLMTGAKNIESAIAILEGSLEY